MIVTGMITARQIRAARGLLGWTQRVLASKAGLSTNVVARLERDKVDSRLSTMVAVQEALMKAGVDFISAEDRKGEGVRMASRK